MQHTINLPAGQWVSFGAQGAYFAILDTGAVQTIELRVMRGAAALEEIRTARRGMKGRTVEPFTGLELRATAPAVVELLVSQGAVDLDGIDGGSVNATIQGLPLPVSNDRGTPGLPLVVQGVTIADAPATAATASGPVACGPASAQLVAASATRRAVRFTNIGADPVAITPPAGTWAQRCIVLNSGDTWIEERAANLAWHGITDAAKAASVTVLSIAA